MPDIIFDVDNTLADGEHRQHFLRTKPRNWPAFNGAMHLDAPNRDVVWLLKLFATTGNRIVIASGRCEPERQVTVDWLRDQAIWQLDEWEALTFAEKNRLRDGPGGYKELELAPVGFYHKLYLRADKDYRDDAVVKSEMLDQMRVEGFDPTMVFDDRDRVVKMWRERGLRCMQVNPGDF